jgi:hypothetical protein
MYTFINLLIGLLIGLFFYNLFYFRIREGQGPMVGSIMFPTSYKGITDVLHKKIEVKEKGNTDIFTQADTEVVKKEDERVDTDIRTQTWLDKKKDVDEKKNVDIVDRQELVRNVASITDCNKKKEQLFKTHANVARQQQQVKMLLEWTNKLAPTIINNENKSKKNTNTILNTSKIIGASFLDARDKLDQNIPSFNSEAFTIREGFREGYREGQPMVGSIMFPTMYQGKTDVTHKPIEVRDKQDVKTLVKTEVTEKTDKRTDKDVRGEHWHEQREDVDVKKDEDVVHRYPEIWNLASQKDCHEKKKIIFENYNTIKNLQEQVKNLSSWVNNIMPSIRNNERSSLLNSNKLKYNSTNTTKGMMSVATELGIIGEQKKSEI